jgi:hypothetical protein
MKTDLSPVDVIHRNFWFCTIDDPSTLGARDRIGIDHIMLEVDYPHADSTWPDSQRYFTERLASVPLDEARKIAYENAAALYRHPLPEVLRP